MHSARRSRLRCDAKIWAISLYASRLKKGVQHRLTKLYKAERALKGFMRGLLRAEQGWEQWHFLQLLAACCVIRLN